MDCSLPGSSVHGFSRQDSWNGVPLPSPKHIYHPPKKPHIHEHSLLIPLSTQPLTLINLSVTMDLPVLDTKYKRSHICSLLCLASFALHNIFRVHPCCSIISMLHPFFCLNSILTLPFPIAHDKLLPIFGKLPI